MFHPFFSIAIAFFVYVMLVGNVASEVKRPISPKLEFQLQQEAAWAIPDVPLTDFLAVLAKNYRLEFELDEVEMKKHQISKGSRISLIAKETVSDLLTILLEPLDLKWIASGDKIFIKVQDISSREKQESTATPELKKKLSSIWNYEFKESDLEQVIEELMKTHQVQVFVDSNSFEAAESSTGLALQGNGLTTVRNALNHLLKPIGLTWIARGDRILIQAVPKGTVPTVK